MYDYNYNYDYVPRVATQTASNATGAAIWICIAALLAIFGGIIAYYLFVKPENKIENKFLKSLREFLRFKVMLIEGILKVFYIIAAIFITLSAFAWFATGFIGIIFFLFQITIGNIVCRVIYESIILKIMIWKNTQEINKKMK